MLDESPRDLGRYVLYDPIASGGMATVHFGRMHGAVGFSRLVAIKRLHRNFATDPSFVQMFIDEARLAARLDHPNVVKTLDVVADETEVFLVMEHILGESLEGMMPRESSRPVPLPIVSAILCGLLEGLHSAHEARSDQGEPLEIVHRDVSPHNILVGVDGVPRVFDFGIAKAAINRQETQEGVIKGKVTYMAPEQVWGKADRRADVYAAGVILWELLAGKRRHAGASNDTLFLKLAKNELDPLPPPTSVRSEAPPALDAVIERATAARVEDRYATAREMAVALEQAIRPAHARDVGVWLREVAGDRVERRSAVMRRIEAQVLSAKDSSETLPESGSTRSVTTSITRAGGLASSVRPVTGEGAFTPPAPERRRSWAMAIVLFALTAALLVVGLRVFSRPAPVVAASAPPQVTPGRELLPVVVLPLAPPAPAVHDAGALPAVASTSAPASAAPPPARPVSTPSPPAARPARMMESAPPSATTTSTHKPSCESPFVIGPDGIRQVKPECL